MSATWRIMLKVLCVLLVTYGSVTIIALAALCVAGMVMDGMTLAGRDALPAFTLSSADISGLQRATFIFLTSCAAWYAGLFGLGKRRWWYAAYAQLLFLALMVLGLAVTLMSNQCLVVLQRDADAAKVEFRETGRRAMREVFAIDGLDTTNVMTFDLYRNDGPMSGNGLMTISLVDGVYTDTILTCLIVAREFTDTHRQAVREVLQRHFPSGYREYQIVYEQEPGINVNSAQRRAELAEARREVAALGFSDTQVADIRYWTSGTSRTNEVLVVNAVVDLPQPDTRAAQRIARVLKHACPDAERVTLITRDGRVIVCWHRSEPENGTKFNCPERRVRGN